MERKLLELFLNAWGFCVGNGENQLRVGLCIAGIPVLLFVGFFGILIGIRLLVDAIS